MDNRASWAVVSGVVAVLSGLLVVLADVPALAFVTAAAGVLAAGLAVDLAKSLSASTEAARAPTAPTDESVLVDAASGFFIEAYFLASLDARVATARRVLRPLSVSLVDLVETDDAEAVTGPVDLAEVREAVMATLREADMAFRVGESRFALLLEDTPEDGSVWTVERIRRAVGTAERGRRMSAGVASYPNHGLTAAELLASAEAALELAREWPQDRIEVADATT